MQDKKHILIVAPYVTFPHEMGMNRFIYLAKMLSAEFDVTLVTSKYCHFLKKHRERTPELGNVKVILLDEPGYRKNVSLQRLISHRRFCRNFETLLKSYDRQIDAVYSAYPLIRTNYILGRYKQSKNFKLIIDVQDVWPEAIAGPIAFFSTQIGKMLMKPITQYADKTYSYADALVAVSETYLQRADVNRLPARLKSAVYIGGDFLFTKSNGKKATDKLVATYLGTMAGSYDLETVVRAAPLCSKKVKIQFIGTGPHEASLQALNRQLGGHVTFLGVHPYKEAMRILADSDVALNAIKASSEGSITNKLSDYICCALPILSCQKHPEVEKLLALGGGIQYTAGDHRELAAKLDKLAEDQAVLDKMSQTNLSLAKEKFLRERSYKEIEKLIKNII
ncbi:glycosyltransferase WbuB [Actinobacillus succinogenes]|uniref:Glycosyl transferase group 1 n=1 Tax=Actinobacillus succinogenes (strain ATCC 55618 / DSM 22257 / CCUG 43843 / 130Z) TaxID=339671 RepID=A6VKI7_ACTSZ|nr:glycosyltransferase [Actinobacillus succinogenes]ABR73484.1 glycosyl transferase group 1 [Actinobacillus succinogenes 130Z]PHI40052.1 glycosyltransferase WbuB [Actinobacillus succinogenes]